MEDDRDRWRRRAELAEGTIETDPLAALTRILLKKVEEMEKAVADSEYARNMLREWEPAVLAAMLELRLQLTSGAGVVGLGTDCVQNLFGLYNERVDHGELMTHVAAPVRFQVPWAV